MIQVDVMVEGNFVIKEKTATAMAIVHLDGQSCGRSSQLNVTALATVNTILFVFQTKPNVFRILTGGFHI